MQKLANNIRKGALLNESTIQPELLQNDVHEYLISLAAKEIPFQTLLTPRANAVFVAQLVPLRLNEMRVIPLLPPKINEVINA